MIPVKSRMTRQMHFVRVPGQSVSEVIMQVDRSVAANPAAGSLY